MSQNFPSCDENHIVIRTDGSVGIGVNSQTHGQFYSSTVSDYAEISSDGSFVVPDCPPYLAPNFSPFYVVTTNQDVTEEIHLRFQERSSPYYLPFQSATESAHLIVLTPGVPLINLDIKKVLPFSLKKRMLRPIR